MSDTRAGSKWLQWTHNLLLNAYTGISHTRPSTHTVHRYIHIHAVYIYNLCTYVYINIYNLCTYVYVGVYIYIYFFICIYIYIYMSYSCGKESYRVFDEWNSKALPSPQVSRNIRSQTSPNATKAETPPGSRWSYCCHMANVPPPKPGDMGPRDCQPQIWCQTVVVLSHLTNCNAQEGSKMVQIKPPTDRCQPDEVARRTIVWRCGNVHRRRQCFYMSNCLVVHPCQQALTIHSYVIICLLMCMCIYIWLNIVYRIINTCTYNIR